MKSYLMKFIVIIMMLSIFGCGFSYSEGSRMGVLAKFSKKGIINKTWEGELTLNGGIRGLSNTTQSSTWHFSVLDDKIAERIKKEIEPCKGVAILSNIR